jgi:integrase
MKLKKINNTYHVCFKADDGSPVQVDTGCKDYKEAKAVAWKSKAAELEQIAKVTRLTAEMVSRIVSGKDINIKSALGKYSVWATKNLVKRTAGSHVSYAKKWAKEMDLEEKPPQSLEDSDVFDWINTGEEIKSSTRRVRKAAVKSFLDFCFNKGWMLHKPADNCRIRMDLMTHKQKETKSHTSMNDEDIKVLLKEANAFWKMAIHLATKTGLRLGDICSIEWACFDGNKVNVWTDKRDKRISIKIPVSLVNALCNLPVSDPTYVFPEEREEYLDVKRRSALSVRFKRLCEATAKKTGRNSLKKKSFHGLRSYYAKNKKNNGVKVEEIAKDLGHSNTKTTGVYINAK